MYPTEKGLRPRHPMNPFLVVLFASHLLAEKTGIFSTISGALQADFKSNSGKFGELFHRD